jgi:hypothetical protein
MSESYNIGEPTSDVPAIVGEIEAGRAAKVLREITKLIKTTNSSEFDIACLLHEVKSNHYFSPAFESFSKFAKSLKIKYTRAYYYVKIIELMLGVGLEREVYEPVGMGKLRVISKLNLEGEYKGVPMPLIIKELTEKAEEMSLEEVTFEVETILGLTEDESMVWLNIHLKKLARENCVKPALALAKKHMPESQTKDDDGNFIDPSDGAALEMICANFLADPNWNPTPEQLPAFDGVGTAEQDSTIEDQIADLEQKLQDQ